MTRRFRVTIGGVTYNVDVEELGHSAPASAASPAAAMPAGAVPAAATPAAAMPAGGVPTGTPAAAIPTAAPAAGMSSAGPAVAGPGAATPAAATAGPPSASAPAAGAPSGDGQPVCAPLPGMIVDVKVEVGQQVREGEVVAVLEAMKMENDITSPYAGVVKQVLVSRGASVGMNDPLVVIG